MVTSIECGASCLARCLRTQTNQPMRVSTNRKEQPAANISTAHWSTKSESAVVWSTIQMTWSSVQIMAERNNVSISLITVKSWKWCWTNFVLRMSVLITFCCNVLHLGFFDNWVNTSGSILRLRWLSSRPRQNVQFNCLSDCNLNKMAKPNVNMWK